MTALVDERGAVDYLDISKAFVTVSHKILDGKLKKYRLTLLKSVGLEYMSSRLFQPKSVIQSMRWAHKHKLKGLKYQGEKVREVKKK